jgi:hypothetical protein
MSGETPSKGDRYVKRHAPDEGRVITVTRIWEAEDGHTAVAYEWEDRGTVYSACPLDVFRRTYRVRGGVTAAGAIHNRIHGEGYCSPPCGLCQEVSDLLEDHAHELAEKIRNAYSGEGPEEHHWIQNPFDAADLIDPEVSTDARS